MTMTWSTEQKDHQKAWEQARLEVLTNLDIAQGTPLPLHVISLIALRAEEIRKLVMPEFISTENPEGVAKLVCMLADGLRRNDVLPTIIKIDRPK